jgi:acyl-CoA synthetase (AMP-forming)/AMP-acid ligase II
VVAHPRSLPAVEFNLADLFEAVARTVPDAEALVCADGAGVSVRWSYAQLDARADRLAHALTAQGIGPHDFVGLHLHNGPEFIEGMLALYKLRAVPVNVNYRYVADELGYLFADSGMRAVITEPDMAPLIDSIRDDLPDLGAVLVTGDGYDELLATQPQGPVDVGPRSGDDRYVLYTGGTTGRPKGVLWRHEDIYFASLGGRGTPSKGVAMLTEPGQIVERARRGDPIMRRLPLCPLIHGGAMWVALQTLLTGGALVLDSDRHFDPTNALDLLAGERVELTMLIGDATARPLADSLAGDRGRWDLSGLQVIASGGAVLSASVKEQLRVLLPGTAVIDTFGASETGGQGRLTRAADGGALRLVTDEETAVLGDDLQPVGPGEVGRLARCGYIPLGYHGDAARTAATFVEVDGVRWSVPGDLARLERDGSITLLGRGSTSINTGGEKVFPEEVENIVKSHPAVFDALVVGVPDERFGERVAAVIAYRPSAEVPTVDELAAHCRVHLSGYKVPRLWVPVARCARLPTGKPDYAWARPIAAEASDRVRVDPAPG